MMTNEQKTNEGTEKAVTTIDTSDRDKSLEDERIKRAHEAAERLERAVDFEEKAKLANEAAERLERVMNRMQVSGRGEAGIVQEKKEETPQEFAKRVRSGEVRLF